MFRFATTPLLTLTGRGQRAGIIINWHTLTRDQLRMQLDVLGEWFEFISLEELPSRLARPTGRPFCLLTIDDGKRSHFTEIAPELHARGIPAVFYVTAISRSAETCLWFDRHEQLVRHLGYCPERLELNTIKRLPFNDLMKLLDKACEEYRFKPDYKQGDAPLMSWDEVRSLSRSGFAIGAHGLNHAILTNETREQAFTEIEKSLSAVSHELGIPCRTFAFPNGNFTGELAQHAARCGATMVMTTEPKWVDREASLHRLPRVQLFGGFTPTRIELKLALATRPGILTNPDGSGRAYSFSS